MLSIWHKYFKEFKRKKIFPAVLNFVFKNAFLSVLNKNEKQNASLQNML